MTLGNASYALYLSHTFAVNLLLAIWLRLDVMDPWVFVAIASVSSVVASLLVYFILEKPTLAFLKDRYAHARRVQAGFYNSSGCASALISCDLLPGFAVALCTSLSSSGGWRQMRRFALLIGTAPGLRRRRFRDQCSTATGQSAAAELHNRGLHVIAAYVL